MSNLPKQTSIEVRPGEILVFFPGASDGVSLSGLEARSWSSVLGVAAECAEKFGQAIEAAERLS